MVARNTRGSDAAEVLGWLQSAGPAELGRRAPSTDRPANRLRRETTAMTSDHRYRPGWDREAERLTIELLVAAMSPR